MNLVDTGAWSTAWAWSLPLIVMNVVFHVVGLGFINAKLATMMSASTKAHRPLPLFVVVVGVAAVLATLLLAVEGSAWALAYRLLGALPDNKSAMLYSIGALTTYGHANLVLASHWQMMGALEALNGIMLFGLTTASLFALMQKVWPFSGYRAS
jgi:hypothetical protein